LHFQYQEVSSMWWVIAMAPRPVIRIYGYEKLAKIQCKQVVIKNYHEILQSL